MSSSSPSDPEALLDAVYDELRRLAASRLSHERPGQTLQATALVHEAWLRMGGEKQPAWSNTGHFFAAAAESMRRILVDNARRKQARKHGGDFKKISAEETSIEIAAPIESDEQLLLVHEALNRLSAHDPRKAELVKQRYFCGFTLEEAAEILDISPRTAKRDWAYAKAWLFNEVQRLRTSAE